MQINNKGETILLISIILVIISAVVAYFVGSVSFAVIITNKFSKKDVRNYGSGNAGMTNVMRVSGVGPGLVTFLGDTLKGYVAAAVGFFVFTYIFNLSRQFELFAPLYGAYLCSLFAVIGHVFPILFDFRGGKAVSTTFGAMLFCNWPSALIALGVFLAVLLITSYVSAGSIAAALSLVITMPFFTFSPTVPYLMQECSAAQKTATTVIMAIITAIVFIKHKDNIVRIFSGTEKSIYKKKK